MNHNQNPLAILRETLYSDDITHRRKQYLDEDQHDRANSIAKEYLEASLAANVPSFPLSDQFVQAQNYKGIIYLAIQHLMQAMSGSTAGLERPTNRGKGVAQTGAQYTDQGYEPFTDHPLHDIINNPNPADTFVDFLCQCIMNWNLHGRILIWGRPNNVGAPIRLYCLPVPLVTPAFPIGNSRYPLGAWRLQQYYPGTGISGILPAGLVGSMGGYIDAREVYDMKNPHPIFRWAPYSHLFGGDDAVDTIRNIDLSFWSIMSQGPKPAGMIDAPGADDQQIRAIQHKIDNAHGGARKHGRPIVIGGGDLERPLMKWTPLQSLVPDALHSEGWELYTSFVLAIFGLDMAAVGLRRSGGHAERWAARRDEREGLKVFLSKFAAMLTKGACRPWGLLDKGVRVAINMPEDVGYDPAEMSRDMAGDGTGTFNEVRHLRGLKSATGRLEKYGDLPVPVALKMIEKDLGIDEASQQKEQLQAEQQAQGAQPPTDEQKNNPENNRPDTPKAAKGSLGGEGAGAEKVVTKSLVPTVITDRITGTPELLTADYDLLPQEKEEAGLSGLSRLVHDILASPVLLNGKHHE